MKMKCQQPHEWEDERQRNNKWNFQLNHFDIVRMAERKMQFYSLFFYQLSDKQIFVIGIRIDWRRPQLLLLISIYPLRMSFQMEMSRSGSGFLFSFHATLLAMNKDAVNSLGYRWHIANPYDSILPPPQNRSTAKPYKTM